MPGDNISDVTENENPNAADKNTPSKKQRRKYRRSHRAAQPDYLLGLFTNMAETGGIEIGVTLTVGGSVVTGTLVGRREWLRRLSATRQLEFLEGVQQAWDEDAAEEAEARERNKDNLDYLEPFEPMIHLVEARYVIGESSAIPKGGQGLFWRGLLSEVDGWSFGTLRPGPPAEAAAVLPED